MNSLNYKHLRYYWMVAKTGSISKAAEQLHLTAHAISGQINEFEQTLGVELFKKRGRNLELSDAGRRIFAYADKIFNTGDELLDVLREQILSRRRSLRLGVADAVPKIIAYHLLEPALKMEQAIRLNCREGRLDFLLEELALHKLDAVIADRSVNQGSNIRLYPHLLGKCSLSVFASPTLAQQLAPGFPDCLKQAPVLIPGEDSAVQSKILHWLAQQQLQVSIVGEFDDGALMKAFGRAGIGCFFAPSAMQEQICQQYQVQLLGEIASITEEFYLITSERRLQDPAIVAISEAARHELLT